MAGIGQVSPIQQIDSKHCLNGLQELIALTRALEHFKRNCSRMRAEPIAGVLGCDFLQCCGDGCDQAFSKVLASAPRSSVLTLLHIFSIGLKIRGVGRKESNLSPIAVAIRARVWSFLCGERLSMITTSLRGATSGTKLGGHEVWNTLGVGGAVDGHAGGGTIQPDGTDHVVVVCQYWPMRECGREPAPHRERVRAAPRQVGSWLPDSSRKDQFGGVKPRLPSPPSPARPPLMSGRSCSLARSGLFYMSAPSSPGRNGWQAGCSPAAWLAATPAKVRVRLLPQQNPHLLLMRGHNARLGAPEKRWRGAMSPVRRRCWRSFLTKPRETPGSAWRFHSRLPFWS